MSSITLTGIHKDNHQRSMHIVLHVLLWLGVKLIPGSHTLYIFFPADTR
jgi:hypothetical protein